MDAPAREGRGTGVAASSKDDGEQAAGNRNGNNWDEGTEDVRDEESSSHK